MVDFFQFLDPESRWQTLVCVGPNIAVCAIYDELSFVRTFGRYCIYRDTATDQIYLGVWGTRLASRFRRLMREGEIEFQLRKMMPPTLEPGGCYGSGNGNWNP